MRLLENRQWKLNFVSSWHCTSLKVVVMNKEWEHVHWPVLHSTFVQLFWFLWNETHIIHKSVNSMCNLICRFTSSMTLWATVCWSSSDIQLSGMLTGCIILMWSVWISSYTLCQIEGTQTKLSKTMYGYLVPSVNIKY